jgi:hypothetical protein
LKINALWPIRNGATATSVERAEAEEASSLLLEEERNEILLQRFGDGGSIGDGHACAGRVELHV